MVPVSCYFFSGEAVLVERDVVTNEITATVYFDRDRLQRALLCTPEDTTTFPMFARIETSDLPESSTRSPISFHGWTAVRIIVMLPITNTLEPFHDENIRHQQWFFHAIASVRNRFPDRDSVPKLILFTKTPKHEYHVSVVYSQIQAAQVCHELGARLPHNCVEALLTLPPLVENMNPTRLTGFAAKALTQTAHIIQIKESVFGDQDDILFAGVSGFGTN